MTAAKAPATFTGVNQDGSARQFLVRALTPIIRILLRLGFSAPEINQATNKIAVDVAMRHKEFYGRHKPFVSHASVVTGLSRKEVSRLWNAEEFGSTRLLNRATRVLCGWQNDARYRDSKDASKPRRFLPFQDALGVSFYQLVREYGGDIPPRSALDSLIKSGAVQRNGNQVELLAHFYVPSAESDELVNTSAFLAGDFLSTLEFNLRKDETKPRLMREWFQRYVPLEEVPTVRAIIREEAMECGNRIDQRIAQHSHRNPLVHQSYQRVGIGMFYVQEDSEAVLDGD